jgi:hypothetical protein
MDRNQNVVDRSNYQIGVRKMGSEQLSLKYNHRIAKDCVGHI